jgi:hypothetical protein
MASNSHEPAGGRIKEGEEHHHLMGSSTQTAQAFDVLQRPEAKCPRKRTYFFNPITTGDIFEATWVTHLKKRSVDKSNGRRGAAGKAMQLMA